MQNVQSAKCKSKLDECIAESTLNSVQKEVAFHWHILTGIRILLVAYFKRAPRLLVSLQLFAQDLYNRVDDWIRSRLIWSIGACDTGVWLSRFIFMIFIYYLYYQEDNSITSMQAYSMLIWSIGAGDAGESGSQDCCSSISSPLQNIIKLLRNLFAISYFSFRIRNWEFRSSARRKG